MFTEKELTPEAENGTEEKTESQKPEEGEKTPEEEAEPGVRINRYLSDAGVCSRREADRLIASGRVLVDGRAAQTGMRVLPEQSVSVDGNPVAPTSRKVVLAVNKPAGIVCTTSDKDQAETIVEMIDYPVRVYPVGRLDKDSEGLILMTNDGALADSILRARNHHEKEYLVETDRPVTPAFLEGMAAGVPLEEAVTRPCRVEKVGYNRFRIVLTQGLNRQIRRMCEYFGYRAVHLLRVRVLNIRLGNLPSGAWRELTRAEEEELRTLVAEPEEERPEPRPAASAAHAGSGSRHKAAPERRGDRRGENGKGKSTPARTGPSKTAGSGKPGVKAGPLQEGSSGASSAKKGRTGSGQKGQETERPYRKRQG